MQIPPAPPPFLFHPGQLLRLFNLQLPLFFFFFFLCKRVFQTMKRVGSEHGTKRKEGVKSAKKVKSDLVLEISTSADEKRARFKCTLGHT